LQIQQTFSLLWGILTWACFRQLASYVFALVYQDGKPASHEQRKAPNSADSRTACEPEFWLLLILEESRCEVGL
jgi:hypothetical protein